MTEETTVEPVFIELKVCSEEFQRTVEEKFKSAIYKAITEVASEIFSEPVAGITTNIKEPVR